MFEDSTRFDHGRFCHGNERDVVQIVLPADDEEEYAVNVGSEAVAGWKPSSKDEFFIEA